MEEFEIAACRLAREEKERWELAAQERSMSLSDLLRSAVRHYLDSTPGELRRVAEEALGAVEGRYTHLVAEVDKALGAARENLERIDAELRVTESRIAELASPKEDESVDELSAKLEELGRLQTRREALRLKRERIAAHIKELEEERRRLLKRKERERARALQERFAWALRAFVDYLEPILVESCEALAPYIAAYAERERAGTIWNWLRNYLGVQVRKKSVGAWSLLANPQPLFASNYETLESFLALLKRFLGEVGDANITRA